MTWVGLYIGIKYQGPGCASRSRPRSRAPREPRSRRSSGLLRYQLNPPFSVQYAQNAISRRWSSTTRPRPPTGWLQGLSAFLRHSLDTDPMHQVTLDQELAAIDLYLGIETIRFAERLTVEHDIAPDCRFPPPVARVCLLQPLGRETRFKHAVAKKRRGRHAPAIGAARRRLGYGSGVNRRRAPGTQQRGGRRRRRAVGVGAETTRATGSACCYGAEQSFEIVRRPEGGCEVPARACRSRPPGA